MFRACLFGGFVFSRSASCTTSVASAPVCRSGSIVPTGADVSAYDKSPLPLYSATQRQRRRSRLRQWLPLLATPLNLHVSRSPRTRRALALRLAVFLAVDIFSSDAPSANGRTHRPPERDPCPSNQPRTTACRGSTAGFSSVLSAST